MMCFKKCYSLKWSCIPELLPELIKDNEPFNWAESFRVYVHLYNLAAMHKAYFIRTICSRLISAKNKRSSSVSWRRGEMFQNSLLIILGVGLFHNPASRITRLLQQHKYTIYDIRIRLMHHDYFATSYIRSGLYDGTCVAGKSLSLLNTNRIWLSPTNQAQRKHHAARPQCTEK